METETLVNVCCRSTKLKNENCHAVGSSTNPQNSFTMHKSKARVSVELRGLMIYTNYCFELEI